MGIIDSLSAGYRLLARRPYLMALPVVLDLLLLAAPRLSTQPFYQALSAWYTQAATTAGMAPEIATMAGDVAELLETIGANSNLLGLLANNSLLHVPSLMGSMGGLAEGNVITLDNPWLALGLALCFGLLSVVIGVVFLELLAGSLPIGNGPKQRSGQAFLRESVRHAGRVLLLVFAVVLLLLFIYIPLSIGLALVGLVSAALSSTLALLAGLMTMVFFFYLYFAVPALILDDVSVRNAMVQSVQLVRRNFLPTFGFVVLTNVIGLGLGLIFVQLADGGLWGSLLAIPANAFIGTGLAIALLLFYRTRVLLMAEAVAMFDRRS